MNKGLAHYIEYAIYYILIFFILRQWLIPVMELTNTGRYELFLLFIALCLVMYLFHVPFVLAWMIKLFYIAWFTMHVYNPFVPFSRDALAFLVEEIRYNLSVIVQMDWAYVSDPFRTFLFFILIWMLVYLIHHWIHVRSTIFYFFVLTVFFIATLDTFSPYNGERAIVEIVLIGLVMTAMLFVKRLVTRTDKVLEWKYYAIYLAPAIVLTLLFGTLAYVLPKAGPQWPDPVPFIQNLSGKGGGPGASSTTVGYSEDDSVLGGPFSPNDELVFTVQAKTKQYWRIETREIYTSRGWETADNIGLTEYTEGQGVVLSTNIGPLEEMTEAVITPHSNNYNFVLYPYGTMRIDTLWSGGQVIVQNPITEKMQFVGGQEASDRYTILYSEPVYSYTALKQSTIEPDAVAAHYLQLPDTLPQRVRDLALQITENQSTAYDKARSIQSYFARSGFRYETQNVPIPEDGQDYVDQFLFETKFGYCDNFSTAMVVMLRSIGIPARWVKGFTGGDEVSSTDSQLRQFEITNNNAHSWVEAYIGGVGWMPFEPTLGYTSPADIAYDLTADETTDPQLLEQQEQERIEREEQELKEEQPEEEQNVAAAAPTPIEIPWRAIAVAMLVLSILAFIVYKRRTKWLPKVYVQMQKNNDMDVSNFEKAYERLLKQLASVGITRQPEQTLQSYAKYVDQYYGTTNMKKLTDAYERVIYSRDADEIDFNKMKESWEYLINRTSG